MLNLIMIVCLYLFHKDLSNFFVFCSPMGHCCQLRKLYEAVRALILVNDSSMVLYKSFSSENFSSKNQKYLTAYKTLYKKIKTKNSDFLLSSLNQTKIGMIDGRDGAEL